MFKLNVIPDSFIAFRIVYHGDRYGLEGCLIHGTGAYDRKLGPCVEFYDTRHDCEQWTGQRCQFIARYYALTLLSGDQSRGLCLDGAIPEWSLSADQMAHVRAAFRY